MKIGLIADLHANLPALQAVLKDMPRVDRVVCSGDLVGLGPWPVKTIELLRRKRKLVAVRGDHDEAVVTGNFRLLRESYVEAGKWTRTRIRDKELRFLKSLPTEIRFKLEGYRFLVVHGSPEDRLTGRLRCRNLKELADAVQFTDADIIVVGHTHLPFFQRVLGKLVINPGSVGQPKDRDPRASYAVVTLKKEPRVDIRRVEYNVERVKREIVRTGLPEELAIRLSFGW